MRYILVTFILSAVFISGCGVNSQSNNSNNPSSSPSFFGNMPTPTEKTVVVVLGHQNGNSCAIYYSYNSTTAVLSGTTLIGITARRYCKPIPLATDLSLDQDSKNFSAIATMQWFLANRGLLKISDIHGEYSLSTVEAVKKFQKSIKVKQTGVADSLVLKTLQEGMRNIRNKNFSDEVGVSKAVIIMQDSSICPVFSSSDFSKYMPGNLHLAESDNYLECMTGGKRELVDYSNP